MLEAKREMEDKRGDVQWHLGSRTLTLCVLQKEKGSHLQPQGWPLSCLNTCQAATSSLDPQEDGHLGAVQASVRKDTDLLWEVRESEIQAVRGPQMEGS